jgi:hypothetical protein
MRYRGMRLFVFLFGAMCGVIGTLAWAMFADPPPPAVAEQPARDDAPITVTFGKPLFESMRQRTTIELPGGKTTPVDLRVQLRDG